MSLIKYQNNMEKKAYYFVYYKCKRCEWKPKKMGGTSNGSSESECQAIIDIHPIQFQLDCNEKYGKEHDTHGGYTAREEYRVVSWVELSKVEYDRYDGMVG